ncbi:MAG: hypothetical protein QMD09_09270 [Desulfatibacillaceae bacterium]|nr:hypothetical protein [Desulfatibacillaceae bacterium]
MRKRTGEKLGWIGGWTGSFLWVGILAVVFLVQGKTIGGVIGLVLFAVAMAGAFLLAPWQHPSTRYYKLMLPFYAAFAVSTAWAVWAFGGFGQAMLNWWYLLLFLPLFSPLFTMGAKTWQN